MRRLIRLSALAALLWIGLLVRTVVQITRPRRQWRPADWVPPPTPLTDVTFRAADGVRLRGWIGTHEDAPSTVICVHGWGANHTEMAWRAHRLHAAGHSILLFDFRASGESGGRVSTGGVREGQDLEAAIELAQSHPSLRGAPIVVLADSMGATVSLVVAAENPAVRAVFSDCAFASLDHAAASGFRVWTGLPPQLFRPAVEWVVARFVGVHAGDLSALASIGRIAPRPVLIAHGENDPLVSPADAEALYAAAGEPKEKWMAPGAGHVVALYVETAEYDARMLALFERALDPEPLAGGATSGPG